MQRDKSIDIAKGLLILFVIAAHTRIYNISNGIDLSNTYILANFSKLFNCFFMQAFFFITGYVSNFAKEKSKFHSDNMRTIMLPLVFLSIIVSVINTIIRHDFDHIDRSLLNISIDYWFVISLFLAKTIYFYIHKFAINIQIALALVCYVLGFVLLKYTSILNLWYFEHSLLLIPFLIAGSLLKERQLGNRFFLYSFGCYVSLFLLSIPFGIDNPVIAYHIHLHWDNLLYGIPFTMAGIFTLMGLSKWIDHNCFLEYFGRNSLPIYILHMPLLNKVVFKCLPYFNDYPYIIFLFEFLAGIAISMVLVSLIDSRYGRWILGKF